MAAQRLELIALRDIPLVEPGDDLVEILSAALAATRVTARASDVLVLAQKIVSKAERRYRRLAEATPSPRARELAGQCGKDPRLVEIILSETAEVLRCRGGVLITEHRLGFVMANAGV